MAFGWKRWFTASSTVTYRRCLGVLGDLDVTESVDLSSLMEQFGREEKCRTCGVHQRERQPVVDIIMADEFSVDRQGDDGSWNARLEAA